MLSAPGATRSRVGAAMHSVSESVDQMQQGAHAAVGGVRECVSELAQSAPERIGDAAEYVREHTRQQTAHAGRTFESLRTELPLILGALGFALGAALSAGLPPTRHEDTLLGEVRDEYVQKAKAFGEEQLEKTT
jgi:hypothetical protein